MSSTSLILNAIARSLAIHSGQKRKGKDVDYQTHTLAVGLILSSVSDKAEVIAAGILHDTVEDCEPYGSYTLEMVEEEFGPEVSALVAAVTEKDKTLPWMERKVKALEEVATMTQDAQLVKAADVLHNITELAHDLEEHGEKYFDHFNASKADILHRYQLVIDTLTKRWSENPLLPNLRETLARIAK